MGTSRHSPRSLTRSSSAKLVPPSGPCETVNSVSKLPTAVGLNVKAIFVVECAANSPVSGSQVTMRSSSLPASRGSRPYLAGSAPRFLTLSARCCCSPRRTWPKSTRGIPLSSCGASVSTVFLTVQTSGTSMRPVIARIGKVDSRLTFTLGLNQIVMRAVTPADIRPGGSKSMSKKSLTLSSSGSSLNWLNFNVRETLVTSITCLYLLPTSKSLKAMTLGFTRKASPFHSLPPMPWMAEFAWSCFKNCPVTTGSFFAGTLLLDMLSWAPTGLSTTRSGVLARRELASRADAERWSRSTFAISAGLALPRPKPLVFCTLTLEGSMRTAVPVGSKTSTLSTVILRM
mmetsp:Transcript_49249/g.142738  ORF Transcript_49249/g.142738 Transcript_49249/m.142738 type:complete len:344 (-) Transcript_49249:573-1604(-)